MKTEIEKMKELLSGLQQMQMDDNFDHDVEVSSYSIEGDGLQIRARFLSNIDTDDEGEPVSYHISICQWKSERENDAEYAKFKYLLMSDVKK